MNAEAATELEIARPPARLPPWYQIVPPRVAVAFLLLWAAPIAGLLVHWDLNDEYRFGYFVPLLALYAAYHRWRTRPEPGQPIRGSLLFVILGTLAVAPMWVCAQPSPDWTLLNWLLTGTVAGVTLAALAYAGGGPWLWHFALPVLLIFTAVPWPDLIESPLTQTLMRLVAACAVEVLGVFGVAALQHGNLIEVGTGMVGVDEACSGIRSLHGSLMASIVLGEFFRFTVSRRLFLIGCSLAVAFVTNVVRASFLAWSAAQSGTSAIDKWHDPAGMTTLAVCIGCILVASMMLDRDGEFVPAASTAGPANGLPGWLAPSISCFLVAIAAATAGWFYDPSPVPVGPLRAVPIAGSERARLGPTVLASFRSDEALAYRGIGPGGSEWLLYFFHWDFGPTFNRVAASMHNPDLCLPASGRTLEAARGEQLFAVAGLDLAFRCFTFREPRGALFVYHGVWPFSTERAERHGPLPRQKYLATWESILRRERNVGQQTVELIISGCRTTAEADAAARDLLGRLLVRRQKPSASS